MGKHAWRSSLTVDVDYICTRQLTRGMKQGGEDRGKGEKGLFDLQISFSSPAMYMR